MEDFRIIFYEKPNGEFPVVDFLNSLNTEMSIKMMKNLDFMECYGNVPKGDITKPVGDKIFELRSKNKTDIARILFFFGRNREIVFTNGYVKKQQKLSTAEFELAKKSRMDYLTRMGNKDVKGFYYHDLDSKTVGSKWRPLYDVLSDAKTRSEYSYSEVEQGKKAQAGKAGYGYEKKF